MSEAIVVTGASGFLGRHICTELHERGFAVRALVRVPFVEPNIEQIVYDGLHDERQVRAAMSHARAVVHLAARVHVMRDSTPDPLAEYRKVNVEGTRTLARLASEAGIASFIFASSVKAIGEATTRAWTEEDPPAPVDAYGRSKLEAEQVLEAMASPTFTTSVLRLPLCYGPGVRANMLRLFAAVDRGLPLPIGGITNSRSLVYARNVGAAVASLVERRGGHEPYFVSDGEDVSTPELIRRIAAALGRRARLLPAPVALLRATRRLEIPFIGPISTRLLGSLAIDTNKLRRYMGGPMPYTLDAGLRATATWYRSTR